MGADAGRNLKCDRLFWTKRQSGAVKPGQTRSKLNLNRFTYVKLRFDSLVAKIVAGNQPNQAESRQIKPNQTCGAVGVSRNWTNDAEKTVAESGASGRVKANQTGFTTNLLEILMLSSILLDERFCRKRNNVRAARFAGSQNKLRAARFAGWDPRGRQSFVGQTDGCGPDDCAPEKVTCDLGLTLFTLSCILAFASRAVFFYGLGGMLLV